MERTKTEWANIAKSYRDAGHTWPSIGKLLHKQGYKNQKGGALTGGGVRCMVETHAGKARTDTTRTRDWTTIKEVVNSNMTEATVAKIITLLLNG